MSARDTILLALTRYYRDNPDSRGTAMQVLDGYDAARRAELLEMRADVRDRLCRDAYAAGRAEALTEAKTEVVAWLLKKGREQATWDVGVLASKVDRGAVRAFLGTGHYRDAMDEHRAEVLAEDGQAYDGELAMLRGLARTLRVVVRPDEVDVAEVRRLLHEHASDDAAAREEQGHREATPVAPADAPETEYGVFIPASDDDPGDAVTSISVSREFAEDAARQSRCLFPCAGQKVVQRTVTFSPWTDVTEGGAADA